MRILVTGSSGFVGRHLVPRLLDEGDEVFALRRNASALHMAGVVDVAAPADLSAIDARADWPGGLDLVIHLAARNPERGTKVAGDLAALMSANADGTAALARRAAGAGIPRFLYISTANVHGPSGQYPRIEDDPCEPDDAYARSKLEGERHLREILAGGGTQYTILRPAPVYGPGSRGAIAALERLAKGRLPLPFASLRARRSVLAVGNLVDALLLSRNHPGARDQAFLVADDDAPTLTELVEMMRAAKDRPSRQFAMHPALVKASLGLLGKGEVASRLATSFVLDTSKIRLRLGWRPRLATREALAEYAAGARP